MTRLRSLQAMRMVMAGKSPRRSAELVREILQEEERREAMRLLPERRLIPQGFAISPEVMQE